MAAMHVSFNTQTTVQSFTSQVKVIKTFYIHSTEGNETIFIEMLHRNVTQRVLHML